MKGLVCSGCVMIATAEEKDMEESMERLSDPPPCGVVEVTISRRTIHNKVVRASSRICIYLETRGVCCVMCSVARGGIQGRKDAASDLAIERIEDGHESQNETHAQHYT